MVIYDCGYILKNFINKGKRHMDYEKKKKYNLKSRQIIHRSQCDLV